MTLFCIPSTGIKLLILMLTPCGQRTGRRWSKSIAIPLVLLNLTTLSLAAPLAALIGERVFLANLTFFGARLNGESFSH